MVGSSLLKVRGVENIFGTRTKRKILNGIGKFAQDQYKRTLKAKSAVASGNLRNSITYAADEKSVKIIGLFYGRFIDRGTKPHNVSMKVLERWARTKFGHYGDAFVEKKALQAHASIARKGIQPKNISDRVIEEIDKNIGEIIEKNMG